MNSTPAITTRRALARFALVVAASATAASIWAQNRPEQGLLLDAETWQDEVVAASTGDWPGEGWYRIVAQDQGIEVRAVRTTDRTPVPADALFFRLKGATLKTGVHASYRHLEVLHQPRLGRDHEMALRGNRFSLRVEEVPAGVQYAVGYGGRTYTYIMGPKGSSTSVRSVADIDGDKHPDLVVDVEDQATFLLLSTQARPGANLPTAELPVTASH